MRGKFDLMDMSVYLTVTVRIDCTKKTEHQENQTSLLNMNNGSQQKLTGYLVRKLSQLRKPVQ